jgi:hypothetical protein
MVRPEAAESRPGGAGVGAAAFGGAESTDGPAVAIATGGVTAAGVGAVSDRVGFGRAESFDVESLAGWATATLADAPEST